MIRTGLSVAATREAFLRLPIATALRSRLDEPWRAYHVWAHPMAMLDRLVEADHAGVRIHDPVAAVGFCLWHDSIYDPRAEHGRNEELSAVLCETEMSHIAGPVSVASAAAATRATATHRLPDATTCPDGAILLDVDLSILGADEDAFWEYERGIAYEYAHVPQHVRNEVRSGILTRFLERDRLYLTDWAHERWDARARANLAASIGKMKSA